MTTSDFIAVLALVISSGGLFIQIRSWMTSKPRLLLSTMAEAESVPKDGKGTRAVVTVTNRGSVPTMLTHMVAYTYDNRWKYWRGKPSIMGIVTSTDIPAKLEPNAYWLGQMSYTPELRQTMKQGKLYLGVIATHSNKIFLARVIPPSDSKVPATKIEEKRTKLSERDRS